MELTDIWFVLIAVLWIGYFVLEGFDFGVGMLLPVLGRDETDRRVMINTIGPVWDGNEVWLIVAGGATFAAFPEWYARLFSGFYLALLLILVALIVRGVAFEYRGKVDDDRWRRRWDLAIIVGSRGARAAVGRGVRQHRAGRAARRRPRVHRHVLHAAQPVRAARRAHHADAVRRARRDVPRPQDRRGRAGARHALAARLGVPAVVLGGALPDLDAARPRRASGPVCRSLAPPARSSAAVLVATVAARAGRSCSPAWPSWPPRSTLFGRSTPTCCRRRTDPAYSLTTTNAASTPYTLTIMTWVAVVLHPDRAGLPGLDATGCSAGASARRDIPAAAGPACRPEHATAPSRAR